ncbi:hypothetical protein [Cystobacter fuscus]|uniref:AbiTii domain-containing protein n=1 Tax=Cystobacter fuscus TaxID=43 RepID=UPI0012DD2C37
MPKPLLVDELIQLAQDEDTPLPELLRRTRVLAAKLKIPELEAWVKKETSGYTGQPTDLPDYRRIPCELRALNLVRGWIPVVLEGNDQFAEHFGLVSIHQSVAEIETLLESENGNLTSNVAPGEHSMLAQIIPQLGRTQVVRLFGKASLKGVLEAPLSRSMAGASFRRTIREEMASQGNLALYQDIVIARRAHHWTLLGSSRSFGCLSSFPAQESFSPLSTRAVATCLRATSPGA